MEPLTFSTAIDKLAGFGIRRQRIYLIDLILLCEMAWADGQVQPAERAIIFNYIDEHVARINRNAGCRVVTGEDAREFITPFLDHKPDAALCATVRQVIAVIRLEGKDPQDAEGTRGGILNACLDIAASSVTRYPYGLTERFSKEEKQYFHTVSELLNRHIS